MPDTVEGSIQAAELAIFQRKSLSLAAAGATGLPGRFESFLHGGLRASMATAEGYGFLNTVEAWTKGRLRRCLAYSSSSRRNTTQLLSQPRHHKASLTDC